MKKTAWIDAFRGIQKRFVSFLSIVLIVALGTGGFFVTQYMRKGLLNKADSYYEELNFKDFQMVSSLGVTDDDIRKIERLDGVKDAEGVIQLSGKYSYKGSTSTITILSVTSEVSVPEIVEGRSPKTDSECMVSYDFAQTNNIRINDPIELSAQFNNQEALKNRRFTIVGFFNHPNYVRSNAYHLVLLDKDSFDSEAMNDLYTTVFVAAEKDRDYIPFEEEYYEDLEDLKNDLNSLARDLEDSSIRYMQDLGNRKIDEEWLKVKKELDEAQEQINSGQATLTRELASASYQISSGQKKLNDGYAELVEGQIQIEAGESELNANMSTFNLIQNALNAAGVDLDKARAESKEMADYFLELVARLDQIPDEEVVSRPEEIINSFADSAEEALNRIEDSHTFRFARAIALFFTGYDLEDAVNNARASLDNLRAHAKDLTLDIWYAGKNAFRALGNMHQKIVDKIDEINRGKQAISDARSQLNNAKRELAYGWNDYENGKSQLASARSQYAVKKAEAEEQIMDAQTLLDQKRQEAEEAIKDARAQLDDIKCTWIVTDRRADSGYIELKGNVDAFKSAGIVFGIMFSLVGGLVCLSTLIIIIEEERKYVGTAKAFGFKNNEILGKYLLFGVLAVIIGMIIGVALAYFGGDVIMGMIGKTGMFVFGKADISIDVRLTLIVGFSLIIMATLVSMFSCTGLLRSPASTLMKGQIISNSGNTKKSFFGIGEKGSLYSRLILRNILTDKARVIISIIIVAGSVLVVGAGISIKESFQGMQQTELKDVMTYDVRIDYNSSISSEEFEKIEKVLKKRSVFYLDASYFSYLYKNNEVPDGLNLIVADKKEINNFIQLKDPDTRQKVTLPESGFLAQNKLMEKKDLKPGDIWVIYDGSLNKHYISYAGCFNNHVGRIIMMSEEAYEEAFGEKATHNCIYVNLDGADYDKLVSELLEIDDDLSFNRPSAMMVRFSSVNNLYDIIVYVMIAISILMSFMILTNLANIFINRKKKELIVMRINGFSIAKTKNYLIKETVITTIAGLVLGTAMGVLFFSKMAIKAMEGIDIQFVRAVYPEAWVIAVALESLFALIIYWHAFRKVEKLDFREVA